MPIRSPFHERTESLCHSYRWKDWAGYYAVCRYDSCHEPEYFAFRHSAGLLDVTPLYKYEVHGPDACALLSRMTVRDVSKLKVGRVTYCCWCDDDGKVVDDGTISRLDDDYYRLTAADPTYHWLRNLARGLDVVVEDSSVQLAALALQGPTSRNVLHDCAGSEVEALKFFAVVKTRVDDIPVWISRTGYTGDLGYEIWTRRENALKLWDAVLAAGKPHGILPAGLDALDMTRIEAGFILLGVDYFSSLKTILDSRKSSPFEIGLGWTVKLDREPLCVGHAALRHEVEKGSRWRLVGLEADWEDLEDLYESYNRPPSLPAEACREPLPIYADGKQVGQATSHVWSPTLKKMIALASVRSRYAQPARTVQLEHTVEFERRTVSARIVETPFFNPERKRRP